MAATVVLLLILIIVGQITTTTAKIWKTTTQKLGSFGDARAGYDQIVTTVGQAVLNTYVGYDSLTAPTKYGTLSELQFLSFPMVTLNGNDKQGNTYAAATYPTHGLFFEAPSGAVSNTGSYGTLPTLLNEYGYFIQFGSDQADQPSFLSSLSPAPALRYRYRLKQWVVPSENFGLYAQTSVPSTATTPIGYYMGTPGSGTSGSATTTWIDFTSATAVPQTLAENVIALVVRPLSPGISTSIAPNSPDLADASFIYNSRNGVTTGTTVTNPSAWQANLLPPNLEIIMVAIDETSAIRLNAASTGTIGAPPSQLATIFANGGTPLFSQPSTPNPNQVNLDLASLTSQLDGLGVRYMVLRSTVKIRSARWSQD